MVAKWRLEVEIAMGTLYLTSILYIYLRLTPTESLQGGGRFTCFRSHNEPQGL